MWHTGGSNQSVNLWTKGIELMLNTRLCTVTSKTLFLMYCSIYITEYHNFPTTDGVMKQGPVTTYTVINEDYEKKSVIATPTPWSQTSSAWTCLFLFATWKSSMNFRSRSFSSSMRMDLIGLLAALVSATMRRTAGTTMLINPYFSCERASVTSMALEW